MLKGYKTIAIALAVTIFGALESFDFTEFLTADNAGYAATGVGVIMFILRAVTKTPMLKGE